uniref:Uncharacterized protein n=1 Tax=Anguilla anguilla TaxID=7936 RepID=A0A0E9SF14_ANGAN
MEKPLEILHYCVLSILFE